MNNLRHYLKPVPLGNNSCRCFSHLQVLNKIVLNKLAVGFAHGTVGLAR